MDCTISVAKTKALISFAVTAKLICVFVFAYAKSRFSHAEAHMETGRLSLKSERLEKAGIKPTTPGLQGE